MLEQVEQVNYYSKNLTSGNATNYTTHIASNYAQCTTSYLDYGMGIGALTGGALGGAALFHGLFVEIVKGSLYSPAFFASFSFLTLSFFLGFQINAPDNEHLGGFHISELTKSFSNYEDTSTPARVDFFSYESFSKESVVTSLIASVSMATLVMDLPFMMAGAAIGGAIGYVISPFFCSGSVSDQFVSENTEVNNHTDVNNQAIFTIDDSVQCLDKFYGLSSADLLCYS
jgi:hypothetical protein